MGGGNEVASESWEFPECKQSSQSTEFRPQDEQPQLHGLSAHLHAEAAIETPRLPAPIAAIRGVEVAVRSVEVAVRSVVVPVRSVVVPVRSVVVPVRSVVVPVRRATGAVIFPSQFKKQPALAAEATARRKKLPSFNRPALSAQRAQELFRSLFLTGKATPIYLEYLDSPARRSTQERRERTDRTTPTTSVTRRSVSAAMALAYALSEKGNPSSAIAASED